MWVAIITLLIGLAIGFFFSAILSNSKIEDLYRANFLLEQEINALRKQIKNLEIGNARENRRP